MAASRGLGSKILDVFSPPPPKGYNDLLPPVRQPIRMFGEAPIKPRINPTPEFFNSLFTAHGIPPSPSAHEIYIHDEWIKANKYAINFLNPFLDPSLFTAHAEILKLAGDALRKIRELDAEAPGTTDIILRRFMAIAGTLFHESIVGDNAYRLSPKQQEEVDAILRKFYEITPAVGGKRRRNKSKKSKRKSRKTRRRH